MKLITKKFLFIFLTFHFITITIIFLPKNNTKRIIIEIDISGANIGEGGPAIFTKGMKELLPYNVSHCTFIASQRIFPINAKNKSDYFYLPFPRYSESLYDEWVKNKRANSLILGPCFVPSLWNLFPYKGFWKERRFREILTTIKGIAVHSTRVRNHLSSRSNTTDLLSKFKIIRPCTNLMPKKIIPFDNRTNDIIFFEKYGDLNRSGEASTLLNLFKNTSKTIKNLVYGKIYNSSNEIFIQYK